MDSPSHLRDAENTQMSIYREMTPTDRLREAVRLSHQMRSLMDAGLRAQYPQWSSEKRRECIAERILHARTG